MGPVKARLCSLKDQTLITGVEVRDLIEGEIFEARFKSEAVIEGLIGIHVIKRVPPDAGICKNIPVILLNKKEPPVISVNRIEEKIPVIEIKKVVPVIPKVLLPKVDYSEVSIPVLRDENGNELPLSSFLIRGNK